MLGLFCLLSDPVGAVAATNIYASGVFGTNVAVVDAATGQTTKTIALSGAPAGIVANSAGTKVYAALYGSNKVSVIDTVTNTETATISVGANPIYLAINPSGTKVYVANNNSTSVSVIDTASNTVTATIPLAALPLGIAVSPSGNKVYVGLYGSSGLSVIDATTNTVTATIPTASQPYQVAVNSSGTTAYVACFAGGAVSVLDLVANTNIANIPTAGGTQGVAVNPSGTKVYAAATGGTIYAIDPVTRTVTSSFAGIGGAWNVRFDPSGTSAYVTNFNTPGTISVINPATDTISRTITTTLGGLFDLVFVTAASAGPPAITTSDFINTIRLQTTTLAPTSSGSVQIQATGISGTWQASTTTPWLKVTQGSGGFPGTLTVTADSTGMAAGSYLGLVTVSSGPYSSPVWVSLTVTGPPALTAVLQDNGAGYDLVVVPAGIPFTVSTSAYSTPWLSVSATSGVAPTAIKVALDPSKATAGVYLGSVTVSSTVTSNGSITLPVTMVGQNTKLPQLVNAAAVSGPDRSVAPNEIATLFLTDVACPSPLAVKVNGLAPPYLSVAGNQINFSIPAVLAQTVVPGSPKFSVAVTCNGSQVWSYNPLSLVPAVPGIFTVNGSGVGQAAAVNADGTPNSSTAPALQGSTVSVYGTGFGVYLPAGPDGVRRLAGTVTAQIGGVDATVLYAGEVPGSTDALQRVDVSVPKGIPSAGNTSLVLWVNGIQSQATATIAVK